MLYQTRKFSIFSTQIFRYIAFLFASDMLLMIFAIACSVLLIDIVELIRSSTGNSHISNLLLLKLAFLRNYVTINKILPFIVLLTTFKVYTTLNHHLEIVGAYSLGMSNLHIIAPAIFVLLLFTLFHALVLLPMSSYSMSKFQKIESEKLGKISNSLYTEENGIWLRQEVVNSNNINENNKYCMKYAEQRQQAIVHAAKIDYKTRELLGVEIFMFDENNIFLSKIISPRIDATKKVWIVYDAHIINTKQNKLTNTNINKILLHFNISFTDLTQSLAPPETINIWKLLEFIRITQNLGFSMNAYYLYFWHTVFRPLFMFVMLIFGFTSIQSYRRDNKTGYILMKLLLYSLLMYFSNELLIIAILHKTKVPLIGVGLPYVLFLMYSLYTMLYHRSVLH